MKYVDWVERVATAYARIKRDSRFIYGVSDVANELGFGDGDRLEDTPQFDALVTALKDINSMGWIEFESLHVIKPTPDTTKIRDGIPLRTAWKQLVEPYLDVEQAAFLQGAVVISEQRHDDWADLMDVDAVDVMSHLGWSSAEHDWWEICGALKQAGYIKSRAYGGPKIELRPNYAGVVKATESIATEWHERLAGLLEEWETTTTDFKVQLGLGTPKQHAEFARDITALANTKASGRERYVVIGFDDGSRAFTTSIDPSITSTRLEPILLSYTKPVPDIRYHTFDDVSGSGEIGVITVIRDPTKVPYRIANGGGKIQVGQVFVRHGSLVGQPDDEELTALEVEGQRAREVG